MARRHELMFALNAGMVDPEALGRVDLEKMRLAGETVENWLPRVLGPMTLRPGLQHLAMVADDDVSRLIPFEYNLETHYMLVMSNLEMRVFNGEEFATVADVDTVVADDEFAGPAIGTYTGGWKDDSEPGDGTSATALFSGANVTLRSTTAQAAIVQQRVPVSGADEDTPHTLRIVVNRGPVQFQVGTDVDKEDIVSEIEIDTGTHLLTFTPGTTAFYIRFRSTAGVDRKIGSCSVEPTGQLVVPTPWLQADLPNLAWDQSADVVFIGDGRQMQRRIERRGNTSWSVVEYRSDSGPLLPILDRQVGLRPLALVGNTELRSNVPYFNESDVGSLIEISSGRQQIDQRLNAENQVTESILVTGVWQAYDSEDAGDIPINDRRFSINLNMDASWDGTVTLERSLDTEGLIWVSVQTYTEDEVDGTFYDKLSNVRARYRFAIKGGMYTNGYCDVTVTYRGGGKTGIGRITAYNSRTTVDFEIIKAFGETVYSRNWRRSDWSDAAGWPRVPRLHDGRLWWFRGDRAYGSVSDDFANYDDSVEGDSGPIVRSIGSGSAEGVRWALDLQRMVVGTSGFEAMVQSSSLDEPLTPTAFTVRKISTLGCAVPPPVKVDLGAIFVQASGRRLYELIPGDGGGYITRELTRLHPSIATAGIVAVAVQREPETRVYAVLGDGRCVVVTYERADNVVAFSMITTTGDIEDVAVLRGADQDEVYFIVDRLGTRRIERMAPDFEQRAVATATLLDAYMVATGSDISQLTGATHLSGESVHVFADGVYVGTRTVTGPGVVSLPSSGTADRIVIGLRYTATYKSVKLAYAAQLGSAIGQTKIVHQAGLVLSNSCLDGIALGKDTSNTHGLPEIVDGATRAADQFFAHYDEAMLPVPSDWDTDSRIVVTAMGPWPATIQGILMDVETSEAISSPRDR